MSGVWRATLRAGAAAAALLVVAACAAAPGPEPSPSPPSSAPPASPSSSTPTPPGTTGPIPSASPTISGVTLRQLGFQNGPLDEFSLPRDAVITTSVDQPNTVTIVLARPGPQTVEAFLRETLPRAGFTIDARSAMGQALTFEGNGWTGGFTGTGATSAIVLRPT